jgi:VWFA-related protein
MRRAISRVRITSGLAIAAVLAASPLAGRQDPPPQKPATVSSQRPIFRGGTNLVILDAYPRRDGRIVEGLTADDFEVLEDGKPQAITQFEFVRIEPMPSYEKRDPNTIGESFALASDPHRRVFVIYLDIYHTTVAGAHAMRQPLIAFLDKTLGPDDLFGIVTPKMPVGRITFSQRTETITDELTRHWDWAEGGRMSHDPDSPGERFLESCFGPSAIVERLIPRYREDLTLRNIDEVMQVVGGIRDSRTVMMVVSDGWMLFGADPELVNDVQGNKPPGPPAVGVRNGRLGVINEERGRMDDGACRVEAMRIATTDDSAALRRLIDTAHTSNVSFYPIRPSGLSSMMSPRVDSLMTIASNTGGMAMVNSNDLMRGVSRIANDTSAYYLLAYSSPNTATDGRVRNIQVRVKQPKVSVTARRGYRAPSAKEAAATAEMNRPRDEPPEDLRAALNLLSRSDIATDLISYGSAWDDELVVVAEIARGVLGRGEWAKGAAVQVTVVGDGNEALGTVAGKIEPGARGAVVRVPLKGNPGLWRAAVRVEGAGEVLADRIVVRPAEGSLLGDPVVYRASPSAQSPLRGVADFIFQRTERVHVEWPLLQNVDRREAVLLDARAQPLPMPVTVTEPGGARRTLTADITLGALGPGDYVLRVTVGHGADSESKFVPLRVLR